MKTSKEAWLRGILSFVGFFIGGMFFSGIAELIIPGGNDFQNSYFYPLYICINVLIALVISCSYVIITKLNELLNDKDDNKKE